MSSGLVMENGPRPDESAGGLPARPTWLKSPRSAKQAASGVKAPLVDIDSAASALPGSPRNWKEILLATVFRVGFGWGWLVSGVLHLALLAGLGIFVYTREPPKPAEISGVFGVLGDETILDSGSSLDAGGALAPIEFESTGSTSKLFDPTGHGSIPARVFGDVEGLLGGNGLGDGGDGSGGLGSVAGNIRVPPSAITKGSFTVWTEPEKPRPNLNYEIVIQVQLSREIKGYRLRDLTGLVTGTDHYEKVIKFKSTERRPVKDGVVQVRITIPGAREKMVKDTIRVHSDILKEEQTIEIVF